MNAREAEDLKVAISANFPGALVKVTPQPEGGEIIVSLEGERDHKYEIDNDYLNSPTVRMLVGAVIR